MIPALVFLAAASAAGPCDSDQTQSDLDVCWAHQAEAADAALNANYKKVRAGLKSLGVNPDSLVPVQLAWISARDKTCDFEESLYEGGSIAPMIYSECVYRMTQARTQRLVALLDVLKAEGVIEKAKPASAASDRELNRVYGLFLTRLTPEQKKKLVAAQVAWLAYRDKACALEGYDCMTALETDRTAELEAGWVGEVFW